MNLSLGELSALVRKAARGAGFDWGIADEAGWAAVWLASHGLPGGDAIARYLAAREGTPVRFGAPIDHDPQWRCDAPALCPLLAGTTLSDCADRLLNGPVVMKEVSLPLLMLPFAGGAASILDRTVVVRWGSCRFVTDGVHLKSTGDRAPTLDIEVTDVEFSLEASHVAPAALMARAVLDEVALSTLERLAHKTYAPATEASRLLGAGAGVSDND